MTFILIGRSLEGGVNSRKIKKLLNFMEIRILNLRFLER
jgi:hypothetical protein